MHISRVQLVNFRNFERADAVFKKGVNTIIGENSSGKTNLFRAIRLLLDADQLRWAYRLDETDFHRGLKNWRGHWIIISLEFSEVSQDEAIQALFLHGAGTIEGGAIGRATYNLIFRPSAAIRSKLGELEEGDQAGLAEVLKGLTTDDYETVLTGKSTADFTDPEVYTALVGDFDEVRFPKELSPPEIGGPIPRALSVTKEICFTFVQALRDVVAEFQGQRTNPLLTLLRSKSGEIDPITLEPITEKVKDLNEAIENLPDVGEIRTDIRQTIRDAAGETYSPANLAVRSAVPAEAERLFQSLRLFVGETEDDYEGAIHELSLGGANLIYLTLKLLEFKYQKAKQACANFLLIEEPEAHIHTHIQKTLFDRLTYTDTQVIYSTHSTHISEVSNVENVNILARNGARCEVYQPTTDLNESDIRSVQRYLDAVRSNLLFAKSVILVEGDAEEILVPALVKEVLGLSLDELGISLINVRSTGFENVAVLFHDDRIRKRCAIVTDLDACFFDTTTNAADSETLAKQKVKAINSAAAGIARQARLNTFKAGNPWLSTHFAQCTFEVEFVRAGNVEVVVDSVGTVYVDPATIQAATDDLRSADPGRFGRRILTMADNAGKGWLAIQLAKRVTAKSRIPPYLLEAIFMAHRPLNRSVLVNMIHYRLNRHDNLALLPPIVVADVRARAAQYQRGEIDKAALLAALAPAIPGDVIIEVLGYA
ncbi:putative ATP-dependent endonuclease of OLD family [Nitrospirillum amazonense]|uniref:Putative ATP-dependent endonuclease of OLD family n=1 Tax=Nitrospirillum amazonense TaxID=28077 RepID=A0A560J6F4_9PROT|nr:AAA family ATPase [Nitrospirillum amazonense]TWB66039.1 putative ATP-dependent endonuclease of OLD family [Nitrospirillum amazonense]